MATTNYLGLLGQGADYFYGENKLDEARSDIKTGFADASSKIQEYGKPYTEFGLESMQDFKDQGQFSFSNEDFYRDPSYDFRLNKGLDSLQRSQAAKKMLSSGNTLASMTDYGQKSASQEYQAAYDRAKGSYETNLDRNKFGVKTGAEVAMNVGDNLADIGIGQGIALAQLSAVQAKRMSDLITSTLASMGQPSDPGTVSNMLNEAISSGVGTVGDFLSDKLGGLVSSGLGALGMGGASSATGGGFTGAGVHSMFAEGAGAPGLAGIGGAGTGTGAGFTGAGVHASFGAGAGAGGGGMLAAAAPWAGPVAGALYGYSEGGVGGAAVGAGGGYAGAKLGATFGSALGPLGTLAGGAIGAIIGGLAGGALFGEGSPPSTRVGISTTAGEGDKAGSKSTKGPFGYVNTWGRKFNGKELRGGVIEMDKALAQYMSPEDIELASASMQEAGNHAQAYGNTFGQREQYSIYSDRVKAMLDGVGLGDKFSEMTSDIKGGKKDSLTQMMVVAGTLLAQRKTMQTAATLSQEFEQEGLV